MCFENFLKIYHIKIDKQKIEADAGVLRKTCSTIKQHRSKAHHTTLKVYGY